MKREEFNALKIGDIVRHKEMSNSYKIIRKEVSKYGVTYTLIRTMTMTNPSEWLLVDKCKK